MALLNKNTLSENETDDWLFYSESTLIALPRYFSSSMQLYNIEDL